MNSHKIAGIAAICALLLLLISCTSDPITSDLVNARVAIDTLSIDQFFGFSYQTPAKTGMLSNLFFGNENGYSCPYTLLNFSRFSSDVTYSLLTLQDSSVIAIDSLFVMLYATDSLAIDDAGSYHINYILPQERDSLFREDDVTYHNLDTSFVNGKLSQIAASTSMQSDTGLTKPYLRFNLTDAKEIILDAFADTSANLLNRGMVVWHDSPDNEMSNFYSRNGSTLFPRMEVQFRRAVGEDSAEVAIVDTLKKFFYTLHDYSPIFPPPLDEIDTTYLSIGLGKGLNSIFQIQLEDDFIPIGAVIKSAELTLQADSIDFDPNGFMVGIYSIYDTVDSNIHDYFFSESDPYQAKQLELIDASVTGSQVIFDIRSLLQAISLEYHTNYGIKLFGSSLNSPFKTLHLHKEQNDVFLPRLRVTYVEPL